jgi:ATP-dependent RNA helicase SUPV3L1/SUV3
MLSGSRLPILRARGVTAILGPTNTGKTYFAIERLIGHKSGMIGLPLRLLAREVYNRVVERVGKHNVALLTGEEKIKPKHAKYFICTVESMPRDMDVAFVAVDEIQLCANSDRGHVFTNALLNIRGTEETLLIGSSTMRTMINRLIPGANMVSRPRLSKLTFAGERKITRLPPRSAIVAFSAEEVYTIAELIRRQRGGAAVVMGALSPRTRNAQVELFQNGEVDHIVATDAIGMGLNLDIDHVAFAADRKFDGVNHRKLHPPELAQIAGRAGRHLKDGTFGTTARCDVFEQSLIEQLEGHDFDDVKTIFWRNPELDFSSLKALQNSLLVLPQEQGVARAPMADDEAILEIASSRPEICALVATPHALRRLWDVCALPDFRKVARHHHADMIFTIFEFLIKVEHIPVDWFAAQVEMCNRVDGEIETLSARLAQIRTWTFCANRIDWLRDPWHWQNVTRNVEDALSDALHAKLAQRFVDRRTSVLMRRLRENEMLVAEVTVSGDVVVEGQSVGKLAGFRFTPDNQGIGADTPEAKTLRAVAAQSLTTEIDTRATKFSVAEDSAFALALDGTIRWQGEVVAKLQAGEKLLEPKALLLADESLSGALRELVVARLELWLKSHVKKLLGPLFELEAGESLTGIGRGLAYQLAENLGVMERINVSNDVKSLDQAGRSELRKLGIRFGSYHLYVPLLLKPAARALCAQLWMLKQDDAEIKGLDDIVHMASSGRTSFAADETLLKDLYRVAGFRVCGPRAVRVDILERLADLIRPAASFKLGLTAGDPPLGAAEGDGFFVTVNMTSLVGCSGADFAELLKSLGYRSEMKLMPKPVTKVGAVAVVEAKLEDAKAVETEGSVEANTDDSHSMIVDAVVDEELKLETPVEETVVEESVVEESVVEESVVEDAVVEQADAEQSDTVIEPALVEAAPVQNIKVEVWKLARAGRGDGQSYKGKGRSKLDAVHVGKVIWVRGQAASPNKPAHKLNEQPIEAAPSSRPIWVRGAEGEAKARGDRPQGDKPHQSKPQNHKSRDAQPLSGVRPAGVRPAGSRPDRASGKGRGGQSSGGAFYASAQPVQAQNDTDSPFAKLMALKAQMEK